LVRANAAQAGLSQWRRAAYASYAPFTMARRFNRVFTMPWESVNARRLFAAEAALVAAVPPLP
jgi:hypothetical protein